MSTKPIKPGLADGLRLLATSQLQIQAARSVALDCTMSFMEPSSVSKPPATDPHRTRADGDTNQPYVHHFKSVVTPGLMSVPPLPDWLRKLFRRKEAPASR